MFAGLIAVAKPLFISRKMFPMIQPGWTPSDEFKRLHGLYMMAGSLEALILLIAFGSVLAMGLPVGTALAGLFSGLALVAMVSNIASMPDFVPAMAAMIGLGVGIDYALFIVTRYRSALAQSGEPHAAVVEAITTAGRAVVFAGTTVVISLMGMLLMK